jgi:hypothetical protein
MKVSPLKKQMGLKLKAIEKTQVDIGKLRDVLRDQISDLEGIANSCDEAYSCIEDGLRAFQDAESELSKYL